MADKKSSSPAKNEFVQKKRLPPRPAKQRNDVYVNRKTDFCCHLEKCKKLLDTGQDEIIIHGMGAAINRAINLALQLEDRGRGTIKISVTTSSVDVVDDFEPTDDGQEGFTKVRTNSAVRIRVYKVTEEEKQDSIT